MFNNNNKRILRSPELVVSSPKLHRMEQGAGSKIDDDTIIQEEEADLEPKEKALLSHFTKVLRQEFTSFSKNEIAPMKQDVTNLTSEMTTVKTELEALKEENKNLHSAIKKFENKVSLLDKDAREFNLVFYNVPKT